MEAILVVLHLEIGRDAWMYGFAWLSRKVTWSGIGIFSKNNVTYIWFFTKFILLSDVSINDWFLLRGVCLQKYMVGYGV